MKEIVVCSGKGGTGKTSFIASFAALAANSVLVDCDVDAADLHLVLPHQIIQRRELRSGKEAIIRQDDCNGCGTCYDLCEFSAIEESHNPDGSNSYVIDPLVCEGCGVCVHFCPEQAIQIRFRKTRSRGRYHHPMITAQDIAAQKERRTIGGTDEDKI